MVRLPENVVILLVDDSADDIAIIQRAIQKAALPNRIVAITDSQQVIPYFEGSGKYADRDRYPLAGVMLLDLKMPGMDGFEVLKALRERTQSRALPVIVLTSSDLLLDVTKAYELGANSYLVKPLEFENLEAMLRTLGAVWKQATNQRSVATGGLQ